MSCTPPAVQEPRAPIAPCNLPAVDVFPDLHPTPTADGIDISTTSTRALFIWVNQVNARLDKAELCLANRE